jgi:hypothetical protein
VTRRRCEPLLVLLVASACGRFGFDPPGGTSSGDGGDDSTVDATSTGIPGARWIHAFGPTDSGGFFATLVAGVDGEVVAAKRFQGTLGVDGAILLGASPYGSTAVVRYDANGSFVSSSVLDSNGYCEPRHITMRGDDALVTGLTIGTTTDPTLGACSIATNRQDPYALRVERSGQQHLAGHWGATGANAQGWWSTPLSDGTIATSGIYGVNLTVGTPLPTATVDPSMFIARYNEGSPAPVWAYGGTSPSSQIHPGPMAPDGNDVCAMGAFNAPITLFGTPLSNVGNFDVWVARLDPSGTPRWIRAIGSPAEESNFGDSSIAIAPGGGCFISFGAPADLTVDSMSFPVAGGSSLLLELDGSGALVRGYRLPVRLILATAGGRLYGAGELSTPFTSGAVSYTPTGSDVVVFELTASGFVRVVGSLGGAGGQRLQSFAAIAGDALAVSASSTGQLVFGSMMSNSGASTIDVAGVLGL